jgi:hypothetical protein
MRNFKILYEFPEPATERLWRECLSQSDVATHYTSPEFFSEPRFRGKKPFAVLAGEENRIDGILTGIHEGRHTVCGLSVRPQISIRKTVEASGVAEQLVDGIVAEGANSALITVYAWSCLPEFSRRSFRTRQEEGVVILDLSNGAEAVRRQMAGNRKTNINFAIKHGVDVHQAEKEEDFTDFYIIYEQWCKKKNLPVTPYQPWREAFELRGNRILFLASASGKIIAGTIVRFTPGGFAEYAANSSLDEYLHLKPNDLLMWRTIEWAHSQGFQKMDLGGAHLFLRKTGGTVVPTYRHRLDRSFLRRHDLRDFMHGYGRKFFNALPGPIRNQIRDKFVRD